MAAKQAMKENLQCTSKYGHLRISRDICHVRMTDIEGFLTIYGHSDNLLNNKDQYFRQTLNCILGKYFGLSFSSSIKLLRLISNIIISTALAQSSAKVAAKSSIVLSL